METHHNTPSHVVRDSEHAFGSIVGRSEAIQRIFDLTDKIAQSDATVLITGESGTGKELVARRVHDRSRRARYPFIAVNCGAIPEGLLESELFGHVRGAFTGALQSRQGRFLSANAGTIFLDEIGEMSPKLQVKLLRVLQERECDPLGSDRTVPINARIVAATNCDLQRAIRKGRFREDLFWRLNILPMELPPLRERREDIPLLLHHFLKQHSVPARRCIRIAQDAMTCLINYDWPGNIRELENLTERLTTLIDHDAIQVSDLPPALLCPVETDGSAAPHELALPPKGIDIDRFTENIHRNLMDQALSRTHGNKTAAATLLGLNRTTFVERMRKLGLASNAGYAARS